MSKSIKVILVTLIFIIVTTIVLYKTGVLRGYYYDTNIVIGEEKVYSYKVIRFTKVKCINHIYFYEDDEYKYYIDKSGCPKEVYYIKKNGKYIDLASAIERNLITPQQILASKLNVSKEEK